MVFGIIDNFANQFQDTIEAFENEDANIYEENDILDLDLLNNNSIKDKFQNINNNDVDDEDYNVDGEDYNVDDEDYNVDNQKDNVDNQKDNLDNQEDNVDNEEDNVDNKEDNDDFDTDENYNNLTEGFNNYKTIEGFTGAIEEDYKSYKLILKSILFGLLFFVMSNSKIYAITKPLTKGLDRQLIHAIIFAIIYYIVNMVI